MATESNLSSHLTKAAFASSFFFFNFNFNSKYATTVDLPLLWIYLHY
jgi:hypothetical protein